MSRALAIETSGALSSVALVEEGRLLEEDVFPHGLQHAAEMIPRIDRLCRSRGWKPADLRELYVSAGPGSFTGLRIGVTLAKTLAFATGARLIAVPTAEVLARNAPPDVGRVLIVLDAKRDQIFNARLTRGENADRWIYEEEPNLDSLAAALARSPRPVFLIGSGIPHHAKFISPDDSCIGVSSPDAWRPRASEVAAIGFRMALDGQMIDPDRFVPIYIRKPEAQEKWEQSQLRALPLT